ncbi:carbohydrate ABC transporter permease [Ruania alba]|uniref:Carbohydrate ABC transporter membrane protein 1, CUT1 family n=1 Tax=Ruania alba TaxID=648782 RepID=A0A1H5KZC5_9MICO|nr:sugar ABC transporter permease [Ruania alba]SEE70175.1 carbohydrate ABC transporter membrane protein 1, CUT1 family [Ruania alba]
MRSRRRSWAPVVFLLPALLVYTLLHTAPFLGTIGLSLFSYDGLRPAEFVGSRNYTVMLQDDVFWHSLRNNAFWFFGEVVVATLVGLGLALLVNSRQRFSALFRTTLFIPYILSWAVAGMLWSRVYNPAPTYGLLNGFLTAIGQPQLTENWLGDPATVFPSVIVAAIWKGFGFAMVIFLAGLQGIPAELTEAARIDGAGSARVLWSIILPLLRPITAIVIIIGLIGTFKVFDPVWVMTQGGPGTASSLLATLVFRAGMNDFQLGYSAALSVALLICTAAVMLLYWRFLGRSRVIDD